MAYSQTNSKGVKYYLHKSDVTLRGGKVQTIFFFAKKEKNEKTDLVEKSCEKEEKSTPENGKEL